MMIEWLHVSIRYHTMKLCCFEDVEGFRPQRLKENEYLALTLARETKGFLMVGEGPRQKS